MYGCFLCAFEDRIIEFFERPHDLFQVLGVLRVRLKIMVDSGEWIHSVVDERVEVNLAWALAKRLDP